MKRIGVLILISIFKSTTSFYTRQCPDGSPNTHETITQEGTKQALSSYIWENKLKQTGSKNTAVDDFFKNGKRISLCYIHLNAYVNTFMKTYCLRQVYNT